MKKSIAAALVASVLAVGMLSGCGTAQPVESENSPTTAATDGTEGTTPSEVAVPNALELEGPVTAEKVSDIVAVSGDAVPSLPATVKDATGAALEIANVDRILALDLYGTLTDTVIGVGLGENLVGRSNSDTQEALKDLPVVTENGHDLNVEAVLNLHPTVILTNTTIGNADKYGQLENAGITVVRFDPTPGFDQIDGTITLVGQALGVPAQAEKLIAATDEAFAQAEEEIARLKAGTPRAPRGTVLYVRGTAGVFFILGAEYGAADVINALGLEDVAAENGIKSLKPANAEALVSLDPEIILAMSEGIRSAGGVNQFTERAGVAATTAGAKERIITASDGQLLSYGPRTPSNLVALARAIYTDGSAE